MYQLKRHIPVYFQSPRSFAPPDICMLRRPTWVTVNSDRGAINQYQYLDYQIGIEYHQIESSLLDHATYLQITWYQIHLGKPFGSWSQIHLGKSFDSCSQTEITVLGIPSIREKHPVAFSSNFHHIYEFYFHLGWPRTIVIISKSDFAT